jgi:DNA polymerase III alpha subunit
MKYSESFRTFIEKYPAIAESINILFKEQRSLGRHAGGVVIMDDAPHQMPLITNSGEPQTPWVEGVGGKYLEPLGIIKYDILGLETMRLISRSIELIIKRHDKIREIELDNGRVLRLFSNQKIMTTSGEKFVKDLSEDDDIIEELL